MEWAAEKRAQGDCKDVRTYDSDDLDVWLEASPAIALAFAEEIGLAGYGVESLGRHWQSWAAQCEPAILPSAFFADRQEAKGRLVTDLRKRTTGGANGTYAIRADNAAEAAAFVCAVLLEAEDLCDVAGVITDEAGWQFVERNPRLRVVIAARPEIAERPAEHVLTIVPVAAGDLASGYGGRDGDGFQLELSRPSIYAFRDALIEIGVEESDAGVSHSRPGAPGASIVVAVPPTKRFVARSGSSCQSPMPWQHCACSGPGMARSQRTGRWSSN